MTPETREALLQALPYTSPAMAEKISGMLLEDRLSQTQWSEHFNYDVDVYCLAFVNATVTQDHGMAFTYLKWLQYSVYCKNIKNNA